MDIEPIYKLHANHDIIKAYSRRHVAHVEIWIQTILSEVGAPTEWPVQS